MKDYTQLWNGCLEKMRQYVTPEIFATWFRPVGLESYDPKENAVLLRVPSVYVYEYIEAYHVRMLKWALSETFGQGVKVQYRILQNADGIQADYVLDTRAHRTYIKMEDAGARLRSEMERCLGERMQWLPAYDRVARWLTDNKGRGLLCVGTSGLGKTVLCRDVLPVILQQRGLVQCMAADMAAHLDGLLKAPCVILDDLGKESSRRYGEADRSFLRLCDAAERDGKLLVITTNLSTTPSPEQYRHLFPQSIEERYGPEVLSRLRSLVLPVLFEGDDMRR